jgi:hypothetical protein
MALPRQFRRTGSEPLNDTGTDRRTSAAMCILWGLSIRFSAMQDKDCEGVANAGRMAEALC